MGANYNFQWLAYITKLSTQDFVLFAPNDWPKSTMISKERIGCLLKRKWVLIVVNSESEETIQNSCNTKICVECILNQKLIYVSCVIMLIFLGRERLVGP